MGGGARKRLERPALRAGKALREDQLLGAVADAMRQRIVKNGLQDIDRVRSVSDQRRVRSKCASPVCGLTA